MAQSKPPKMGFMRRLRRWKLIHAGYAALAFGGAAAGTYATHGSYDHSSTVVVESYVPRGQRARRGEDPDPYPELVSQVVRRSSLSQRETCERAIAASFHPRQVWVSQQSNSQGSHGRGVALYRVEILATGEVHIIPCLVDEPRRVVTTVAFSRPAPPR